MKLVESGDVGWDEPDVAKVLVDVARRKISSVTHQQYSFVQAKSHEPSPSARLTKQERAQIPLIYQELVHYGLTPNRWELEVLARGDAMFFDGTKLLYPAIDDWLGFPDLLKGGVLD